jgi:hypothetical protein
MSDWRALVGRGVHGELGRATLSPDSPCLARQRPRTPRLPHQPLHRPRPLLRHHPRYPDADGRPAANRDHVKS